jgi:hypothetical protein
LATGSQLIGEAVGWTTDYYIEERLAQELRC